MPTFIKLRRIMRSVYLNLEKERSLIALEKEKIDKNQISLQSFFY